jgi:hypothetical protein
VGARVLSSCTELRRGAGEHDDEPLSSDESDEGDDMVEKTIRHESTVFKRMFSVVSAWGKVCARDYTLETAACALTGHPLLCAAPKQPLLSQRPPRPARTGRGGERCTGIVAGQAQAQSQRLDGHVLQAEGTAVGRGGRRRQGAHAGRNPRQYAVRSNRASAASPARPSAVLSALGAQGA